MKVNEIFYSLQGEGYWTGAASVFVRFSGCNLKCSFCDTDHSPFVEMTTDEILAEINRYAARRVVLTGGEPLLQVDLRLLQQLKHNGYYVQVETNGTIDVEDAWIDNGLIDWLTVSPKTIPFSLHRFNEVKIVYEGQDMTRYDYLLTDYPDAKLFIQPCDYGSEAMNLMSLDRSVDYVKTCPIWRLSLQTHKLINIR